MLKSTVNLVQGGIMPIDMAGASADEVRLRCWTSISLDRTQRER
jgi:hypothetical protein